jgi:hypothetical protein
LVGQLAVLARLSEAELTKAAILEKYKENTHVAIQQLSVDQMLEAGRNSEEELKGNVVDIDLTKKPAREKDVLQ